MGWLAIHEFASLKNQLITPGERNVFENKNAIFPIKSFPELRQFVDELREKDVKNRYILNLDIHLRLADATPENVLIVIDVRTKSRADKQIDNWSVMADKDVR